MLIISKFRDYYDSVANTGVDKTIVYDRESIEKELKLEDLIYIDSGRFGEYSPKMKEILELKFIGFCGQVYPFIERQEIIDNRVTINTAYNYIYDIDVIKEVVKKYSIYQFKQLLYLLDFYNKKINSYFFEFKVPIILVKNRNSSHFFQNQVIELNPKLSDIDFYTQKDSWTAFKEVESYISGVLGVNNKPMIEISEQDKLLAHGFDKKWSFRNPDPPKRKRKK